ncbi:MAG: hypothetical protein HYR56_21225 [Acidobacteria bacterium]|nr:hypothetical protein [Acidobacteriota bacterium]MBI3427568.1 hypothetical protein [Acidobacteriota bacterium]
MSFLNRWMIVGRLTTQAPLHIGNGSETARPDFVNEKTQGKIEINAVGTDCNERPYIPGSSLKGVLRSHAKKTQLLTSEQLFGSEDPEKKDAAGNPIAVGGKAEFYDARILDPIPVAFPYKPPHWEPIRLTGVTAAVTLDRLTKTASEQRLFHEEFVPPGVSFTIAISGQDFTDAEITDLLWLLNNFNVEVLKLGAGTGSGYGTLRWELTDLQRMTKDDVAAWIASDAPTTGYAALKSIPLHERQAFESQAKQIYPTANTTESVTLKARLDFLSNFLVNDPSRTGTIGEKKAGHTPLLTANGKPLLPATSLRGAFRAQAEKIVRTIGNEKCACYLNDNGERQACHVDELHEQLTDKLKLLCPICLLFGSTSWKATIGFSDFVATDTVQENELFQQEFVAIDRFTGGGAEAKKFNARSVDRPTLHGTISLNLARLRHIAGNGWPLGLLTLVLRDFMEGDVRLGLGAAKGYGTAKLTIESLKLPSWDDCPASFKAGLTPAQWATLSSTTTLNDATRTILQQWVTELHRRIQTERNHQ